MPSRIKEALIAGAEAVRLMAEAHIECAACYKVIAESETPDRLCQALLEGTERYMEALGNSLDAHDCCDEEFNEKLSPLFDLVNDVLAEVRSARILPSNRSK